jgi:uncharacterized membrane protein YgdD (TMEM256/DUF423 family)
MLATFSSPEAVAQAFHEGMAYSAIFVFALVVAALLAARSKIFPASAGFIVGLGVFVFSGLVMLTYSSTYGCFVGAEVTESGIKLQYIGPLGGDVLVQREAIEAVLFGLPGKGPGNCYIRVQQRSGESFRSATISLQPDSCKNLRTQMQAVLSL